MAVLDSSFKRDFDYWYALTGDSEGAYQYACDMFDYWYLGICKFIDHCWHYGTNSSGSKDGE